MTGARVLMLLANNPYPQDGRVRREARTLVEHGYRVTVVCPAQNGQRRHDIDGGVRIWRYRLPVTGQGAFGFVLEYLYVTLASLVLSVRIGVTEGFDVVHVHNPPDTLVVVAAMHKLFGRRFVYDHHDLSPEMYRARFGESAATIVFKILLVLEGLCCRLADRVIATNGSYADLDHERHHVPRSRITVVRNGPELDLLAPVPTPAPRAPANGARRDGAGLVVCYVGEIGPQDGVDHLLRAMSHLVRDPARVGARCLIVGGGDAVPALRAMCSALGLDGTVSFIGRVDRAEVASWIASADICVDPAPKNPYNDRSTMIKIMEYLAMGKPVVAFDLVEHRVTAGDYAVYVQPNDDAAFGEAIADLGDDDERRRQLGAAGRRRVEERLAWNRIAPDLIEAYRSTCREPA